MTDEWMLGYAAGITNALLIIAPSHDVLDVVLDPERRFEGTQDALCLAQQMIAEATGLVGVDETDFVTIEDM